MAEAKLANLLVHCYKPRFLTLVAKDVLHFARLYSLANK